MGPFEAGSALHRPTYPSHITSAGSTGKDRARTRMKVAAHWEKKKNEKTGKKETGQERKRSTDFKEAVCCPSAVVQRAAR